MTNKNIKQVLKVGDKTLMVYNYNGIADKQKEEREVTKINSVEVTLGTSRLDLPKVANTYIHNDLILILDDQITIYNRERVTELKEYIESLTKYGAAEWQIDDLKGNINFYINKIVEYQSKGEDFLKANRIDFIIPEDKVLQFVYKIS